MSDTKTVSPLRQRMIEDMAARKLNPHTQRSHISSCKRFAAWLKRSPDTATPERSLPSRGPTSRDFVPWRFLDACQLSVPRPSLLPASKNLHNSGPSLPTGLRVESALDYASSASSSALASLRSGVSKPSVNQS